MTFLSKMAAPTKMEFMVQMTCQGCVKSIKKALEGVPVLGSIPQSNLRFTVDCIKSIDIQLETEQVIVESSLPSSKVKELIETTGKRAVLQGYGSSKSKTNLGAAVAIMEAGSSFIKGVIRLVQADEDTCVVEGTVDGLPQGSVTVCVHDLGDISQGCTSCGSVIGKGLTEKVKGIITELKVGEDGRAMFRCDNHDLKVWDLIGRSVIIHQGSAESIAKNDNSNRMVCGIVARSAGIFENSKKFCACDGVTIWDERDKPVAGPERSAKPSL